MAIEAGRVGVRADQVDPYGRVVGGGGGTDPAVTKLQTQVGSYSFRTNPEDGSAQYRKSDEDEWANFNSGGGGAPVLLWENSSPTDGYDDFGVETAVDISSYPLLLVVEKAVANESNSPFGCTVIDTTIRDWQLCVGGAHPTYSAKRAYRPIKLSDTGFIANRTGFVSDFTPPTTFRAGETNSLFAIPYKIYGIDMNI